MSAFTTVKLALRRNPLTAEQAQQLDQQASTMQISDAQGAAFRDVAKMMDVATPGRGLDDEAFGKLDLLHRRVGLLESRRNKKLGGDATAAKVIRTEGQKIADQLAMMSYARQTLMERGDALVADALHTAPTRRLPALDELGKLVWAARHPEAPPQIKAHVEQLVRAIQDGLEAQGPKEISISRVWTNSKTGHLNTLDPEVVRSSIARLLRAGAEVTGREPSLTVRAVPEQAQVPARYVGDIPTKLVLSPAR